MEMKRPTRSVVAGWMAFQKAWGIARHMLDLFGLELANPIRGGKPTGSYRAALERVEKGAEVLMLAARAYRVALERQGVKR